MSSRAGAPNRLALRPKEVAEALGVSGRTVRKWMKDCGLPYLRLDGVTLIPTVDLERWLAEQVASSDRTDALAAEIINDL